MLVRIQFEYGIVLSERGQLVQMTWTTGFQFLVGAEFCFHSLYRQATELPTSCPLGFENPSIKHDAPDREAHHLDQLSGGLSKYSSVLEAACRLYCQ